MSGLIQLKQQAYAEIETRYVCDHLVREIRLRTISDGRQTYVSQCVDCGQTNSPISKKYALTQSSYPPPYDPHLEQRRRASKHEEYLQAFLAIRPQLAAEYDAYLESPVWRKRRGEAMQRAKGNCEICGHPAVDIHHLTYCNVGSERPQDLMAVCRCCHNFIHRRTG